MRNRTWALLLVSLAGCGGSDEAAPPVDDGPPPLPKIRVVEDLDDLPAVSDPLTPTDGEKKIGVSIPQGWGLARSSGYIFGCRNEASIYPSLYIKAEDNAGISETTADNFQDFAGKVAMELQQANRPLTGDVEAVQIGDLYGVEYHVAGKSGNNRLTVVYLVTVHGGRRYTIEMRALEGTARDYRDCAYAVAHSLDFAPEEPEGPAIVPPGNAEGQ